MEKVYKLIFDKKYALRYASNPEEVTHIFAKEKINLAILDLKMPRIDGITLLKQIKKESPKTKVIIATGYKTIATAERSFKEGADEYVPKPFEPEVLLEKVKKLLKA
jgi:DNA-binding NtrC family response regulator